MKTRKALSLKVRFHIFDRDGFTCRYCGKSAKDGVVLEVDHIHPVANGGENDIDNLVTACWECNHGKGKVELSSNIKLSESDILQETKLQHYIDVLGLDWVRGIVDCVFESKEPYTGSLFGDILDICEREAEEEEVKNFFKERNEN